MKPPIEADPVIDVIIISRLETSPVIDKIGTTPKTDRVEITRRIDKTEATPMKEIGVTPGTETGMIPLIGDSLAETSLGIPMARETG